jgi:hypothetical protein
VAGFWFFPAQAALFSRLTGCYRLLPFFFKKVSFFCFRFSFFFLKERKEDSKMGGVTGGYNLCALCMRKTSILYGMAPRYVFTKKKGHNKLHI